MALSFEELYALSSQEDEKDIIEARGSDVGLGDYISDIFITGPAKGLSQAVRGLFELGALPIQYVTNKPLLEKIDQIFSGDGFFATPDTKTGIGDVVATLTQFGLPGGLAFKAASGISKLRKASQITKLSSPELLTTGSKAMELVKRAGYYGGISGAVDFAVSSPGTNKTILESFGETQEVDLSELSGRERAAEVAKRKIKFGAEGAVLGGAVPLLPVAGSLGVKYGLVPAAKLTAFVGGNTLRGIDKVVLNPASQFLGGKTINKAILKTGALLDKGVAKTGLPSKETWRFKPTESGYKGTILRGIQRVQDYFTSSGPLTGTLKQVQDNVKTKIASELGTLERITGRLDSKLEDVATNFKKNFFDNGESKIRMQYEVNKIYDFLNTPKQIKKGKDFVANPTYDARLKELDPRVKNDALELKSLLTKSNKRFGTILKGMGETKLGQAFIADADNYFKQRLAAFNNKKFEFDPLKEKRAVDFMKNNVIKNGFRPDLEDSIYRKYFDIDKKVDVAVNKEIAKAVTSKVDDVTLDKLYFFGSDKTGKTLDQIRESAEIAVRKQFPKFKQINKDSKKFKNLLDEAAENEILRLKQTVIRSDLSPEQIFKNINQSLDTKTKKSPLLQKGENLPDKIKELFTTPKAYSDVIIDGKKVSVPLSDYKAGVIDTIISQSKQIYNRRQFDEFAKRGVQDGWLFKNEAEAFRKGFSTKVTKVVAPNEAQANLLSGIEAGSKLFTQKLYTTPELANAITDAKRYSDTWFNNEFYKGLMSLKAAGQISKTILSPVTQVRNFTTAGFFPLANGLIGGNISFRDAFKIVADDIFQGAKSDADKIAKIEDLINRGVIDQNIQVQELKNILTKAQNGKIDFSKLMNTKVMRKLTDIYQGSDNIWKVYADTFYQGALKKAFRNIDDIKNWYKEIADEEFIPYNVLTGKDKTFEEALKDVSAYLTTNTIPTYSKVPNIIKDIRNLPLGNFIAFPAEILRTTSNILLLGARELASSNEFIRQMGARRLIGASTVLGGVGTVIGKTAEALTGVTPEIMESFQRSFGPDYQKNSTLIPLTKPDEFGKFKYFNFSYSNPYNSLTQPVNAILKAYGEGRLNKDSSGTILIDSLFRGTFGEDGRKGAVVEFLSPFITESIGTERAFDIVARGGRTRDNRIIYYDRDPTNVKIAKSINHVIGGLTPGAFSQAERVWQGTTGKFTDYGTMRDSKTEIAALLSGVRVEEAKPLASIPFIATSFNKDNQNIRSKFSREFYSANTKPENKLASYKTFLMETADSQRKMYRVLKDAETLNVDEFDLRDRLEQRLTKSTVRDLFDGRLKIPNISDKGVRTLISRLETEDPVAASQLEDQFETVLDIIKDVKFELEDFELDKPLGDLDELIDELLTPGVRESRRIIQNFAPRPTEQGPNLPTGITGTPVSQQVVAAPQTLGAQFGVGPTGLTRTEQALLSPSEQLIRQRQRGFA